MSDGTNFPMDVREELTDQVGNDFRRDERETSIGFLASDDEYSIVTNTPSIMRRLLYHNYAKIRWLNAETDSDTAKTIRTVQELPDDLSAVTVRSLGASLPVGTLSIKSTPRTTNSIGNVVSGGVMN